MVPALAHVLPVRIQLLDQFVLPSTPPMLDALLHGDRLNDRVIKSEPRQLVAQELICERTGENALLVLKNTLHQIRSDTGVQGGVVLVGHDVHPATFHGVKFVREVGIPNQTTELHSTTTSLRAREVLRLKTRSLTNDPR